MTKLHKNLNQAVRENNFKLMTKLGKVDFDVRHLHMTAVKGRLVHERK